MEFPVATRKSALTIDIGTKRGVMLTMNKKLGIVQLSMHCSTAEEEKRKRIEFTFDQWRSFFAKLDEVLDLVEVVKSGQQASFALDVGDKKRITMSPGYKCLDLRSWYIPSHCTQLRPGLPGIALNFSEVSKMAEKRQEIIDFLA